MYKGCTDKIPVLQHLYKNVLILRTLRTRRRWLLINNTSSTARSSSSPVVARGVIGRSHCGIAPDEVLRAGGDDTRLLLLLLVPGACVRVRARLALLLKTPVRYTPPWCKSSRQLDCRHHSPHTRFEIHQDHFQPATRSGKSGQERKV